MVKFLALRREAEGSDECIMWSTRENWRFARHVGRQSWEAILASEMVWSFLAGYSSWPYLHSKAQEAGMGSLLMLCYASIKQSDTWLVLCPLIYLLVVHILRCQRARSLERKYAPEGRKSFRRMTADDAQEILKTLAELEFPSLYGFSMVVALFRVSRLKSADPS